MDWVHRTEKHKLDKGWAPLTVEVDCIQLYQEVDSLQDGPTPLIRRMAPPAGSPLLQELLNGDTPPALTVGPHPPPPTIPTH